MRRLAFALAVPSLLALTALFAAKLHRAPRLDGFPLQARAWHQYGGAWQLENGVMHNDSTERGAKLLTGKSWWADYKVESDVRLLGDEGDSGIIVRAQDITRGVDSYEGFFAGLRSLDSTVILGRADYGWKEYSAKPVPTSVKPGVFYHLEVVAVGCRIAVDVTLPGGTHVRSGIQLTRCPRSGLVGLKSYQTPAQWKNFKVTPADDGDILRVMNQQALQSARSGTLHQGMASPNERLTYREGASRHQLQGPTTLIGELALRPLVVPEVVSVHGIVRMLRPVILVEDPTGGLTLDTVEDAALAIGDEVQVTGEAERDAGHLVIRHGRVKPLWSNASMTPANISPAEAAAGRRDDQLVTIGGTLIQRINLDRSTSVLEFRSGGEIFRTWMSRSPLGQDPPEIPLLSEVQLTGVVRSDTRYAGDTAFAVLLAPTDDAVRLLHEAPWWNSQHTIAVVFLSLVICGVSVYAYLALKERYLISIVKERERLAHDLHDTVAQSFAGIGYQLSGLKEHLNPESRSAALLERAQEMVTDSHDELRRSITTLRYDAEGLNDIAGALGAVARRLVGSGSLEVVTATAGTRRRIPLVVADCLFRIGQEAIANALLHAHARHIAIEVLYTMTDVKLFIRDDGCGLRPTHRSKGSGLFGMQRRAMGAGVRVRIASEEHGTTIALEADLPQHPIIEKFFLRRTFS